MNNGLKIILERMKTNPEEFRPTFELGLKRWGSIVHEYWEILTDEEREEYRQALREVTLAQFEEDVLKELMRDAPTSPRIVDYHEALRAATERNKKAIAEQHLFDARQLTLPLVYTQDNTQEK
jgi:hypothetical protein